MNPIVPRPSPLATDSDEPEVSCELPLISVVIATRDRPDSLAICLDTVLAQDYPNFDVIVVDNAPATNATADLLRTHYSQVRYLRENRPGLAAAHNCGLAAVTAPLVAFTDDDVRVDPNWLAAIARAFALASTVACVTGLIMPQALDTPAQRWLEAYGGFSKGSTRRLFDLADYRPADPLFPYTAGRFGSGANMAFKTAILRSLGGFDPALGAGTLAMGGDDLAAFFEMVAAGYTLVYEPAAIVYHRHRSDYADLQRQIYGYGVGLSAFLTHCLLARPGRLLDVARKTPRGLVYLFGTRSPKNTRKAADYPAELTRLERRGFVAGPLAYLRSRRQVGRSAPGLPIMEPTAP
ncbi:MAG: glycosyltransferase [Anaerolineae bacterium]|nr:glycosyltransferase [Anaerolineae bacterium]MCB9107909.1 glycosyltransferase [Anaerolineales bacterium]